MPAIDLVQLIRSAVGKNTGIPAMLDAYGQFADSPIGQLELSNLGAVFSAILENLQVRYPEIASQRAASASRNDIAEFLLAANNDPDRVKEVLKSELRPTIKTMSASISERFSRMNPEERRAIDATLRLLRRSPVEVIFRVESGKLISTSGDDFDRFFAAVRAESPNIKELRYQNLIVEKAVFNKLLLKSKNQDYSVWVPSFFAKETLDSLIERTGLLQEHVLHSRIVELKKQSQLDTLRPFLSVLMQNSGVLGKEDSVPEELKDFMRPVGEKFVAISPTDLDDVFLLLEEEESEEKEKQRLNEIRKREEKISRTEAEKRVEDLKQKKRATFQVPSPGQVQQREKEADSVYIGRQMDLAQLSSAISKHVSENEINTVVKVMGDYYSDLSTIQLKGVAIIGSSGSGRSTTLKRLLDGIGSVIESRARVILIDQKGEHRGIAWKYNWQVLGFVADSQAKQFKLPLLPEALEQGERTELLADMLQEWCLQSGIACTEQQRARLASIIRGETALTSESLSTAVVKEPELEQIAKKLTKNFLAGNVSTRIFSEKKFDLNFEKNTLFDISGRGLRDPTSREERLLLSVLILKKIETRQVRDAIIVTEDVLDRFKSESLRRRCVDMVSMLKDNGNTIITTARSQIRDFSGADCLEIVHRLSGEKTIASEISNFKISQPVRGLAELISMLPRGWALVSEVRDAKGRTTPSAAIRIEPVQFESV